MLCWKELTHYLTNSFTKQIGFWLFPSVIRKLQGRKKLLETFCLRGKLYWYHKKGDWKATKDKQFIEQYFWGLAQDVPHKTVLRSRWEGPTIDYFPPFSPSNVKLNLSQHVYEQLHTLNPFYLKYLTWFRSCLLGT